MAQAIPVFHRRQRNDPQVEQLLRTREKEQPPPLSNSCCGRAFCRRHRAQIARANRLDERQKSEFVTASAA